MPEIAFMRTIVVAAALLGCTSSPPTPDAATYDCIADMTSFYAAGCSFDFEGSALTENYGITNCNRITSDLKCQPQAIAWTTCLSAPGSDCCAAQLDAVNACE